MRYANIEIGTKDVAVYRATNQDDRLTMTCCGKSRLEEVYSQGVFCINAEKIISDALEGLRNAGEVDFVSVTSLDRAVVVLDENDEVLVPVLSVRDGSLEQVDLDGVDPAWLFEKSGVTVERHSVLYQLLAHRHEEPHLFERAKCFMFLPDYIRFRLSGTKASDWSMAQAAGMLLAGSREWNDELFEKLGLPNLFPPFAEDGSVLGQFEEDVAKEVGYEANVVFSSASLLALACSVLSPELFITSSLGGRIGLVCDSPVITEEIHDSQGMNLTTTDGRNLLLLPFEGYSLIGRLQRQSLDGTSFDTIENTARENKVFEYIDIRDDRLRSGDVVMAVNALLEENGKEKVDRDVAIGVLYNSIARYTVGSIMLLDETAGRKASSVMIVGKASKDYYLNSLICMHSRKSVVSSTGFIASSFAILSMMIGNGDATTEDAIEMIKKSFGISRFDRKEEE